MSQRSDDQLVALFRMGSEEAFAVIHDRYRVPLLAYTRRMLGGSRSDAEDALQDVFVRAWRGLRRDRRPVALRAWLYRVAHNRCIDDIRRPRPASRDIYDIAPPRIQDPVAAAERNEEMRCVLEDLRRLPEQQRVALVGTAWEGRSYAEIGGALEIGVPAVKASVARARGGVGLAAEARATPCADIRAELDRAARQGVRPTSLATRHMKDCAPCREHRAGLRRTERAVAPGHGLLGALAKLLGLGGAGSGTAAGGGVAAAGGGLAVAAPVALKLGAILCCGAVLGGAAAIGSQAPPAARPAGRTTASAPHGAAAAAATHAPASLAPAPASSVAHAARVAGAARVARTVPRAAPRRIALVPRPVALDTRRMVAAPRAVRRTSPEETARRAGGALAPDEQAPAAQAPAAQAPTAAPAAPEPTPPEAPPAPAADTPAPAATPPAVDAPATATPADDAAGGRTAGVTPPAAAPDDAEDAPDATVHAPLVATVAAREHGARSGSHRRRGPDAFREAGGD